MQCIPIKTDKIISSIAHPTPIKDAALAPRVLAEEEASNPRVDADNSATLQVNADPPDLIEEDSVDSISQSGRELGTKQNRASEHEFPTRYELSIAAQ